MDPIRDSFIRVKQDITSLKKDIGFLTKSLSETRNQIKEICSILTKIIEKQVSTHKLLNKTLSTYPSTLPQEIGGLKSQNLAISTGNEGVPTDRQTHQQTDNQTQNPLKKSEELSVDNAIKILESLDSIKREIRLKFKRLTAQEWLIFSTLYQLEEQNTPKEPLTYKTLANYLKLTESSIRDYIGRLIKKGIPVEKTKINNKTIQLTVSSNLKKIASLSTIIQLRDL